MVPHRDQGDSSAIMCGVRAHRSSRHVVHWTVMLTLAIAAIAAWASVQAPAAGAAYSDCDKDGYLCLFNNADGDKSAGVLFIGPASPSDPSQPVHGSYPSLAGLSWKGMPGSSVDNKVSSLWNRSTHAYYAWSEEGCRGGDGPRQGPYIINPGDIGNMNPLLDWNDTFSSLQLRTGAAPCVAAAPPPAPPAPPAPPQVPPRDACERSPAASGVKVTAQFGRSDRVRTARYGRRLLVRGRVTTTDGAPVAGATLCVGGQSRSGAAVRAIGSIAADSAGRFTYPLRAKKSERILFVHQTGGTAAAAEVGVNVRAPVALATSRRSLRNGRAVVFRGRLRAAARRGVLVELQFPRGRRWQTFATIRTKRGGKFRYPYRFTRTTGTRTYLFRARVPKQPGLPFVTGRSKSVRVRVVG